MTHFGWILFLLLLGAFSESTRIEPSQTIPSTVKTRDFTMQTVSLKTAANVTSHSVKKTITISPQRSASSLQPSVSQTSAPSINASNISSFCAPYNGTVCRKVLSETLTQFNESDRFFDANYGFNATESFAKRLVSLLQQQKPTKRCGWLLMVAFCQAAFPPCRVSGDPVSLCREDCVSLWQECKDDLNRLTGIASALTQVKNIDFVHLQSPNNCSNFPSEKTNNSSCEHIDLFVHSDSAASLQTSAIILYSTVGGVLLVVVIVLLAVVCIKCRKKDKESEMIGLDILETSTTLSTMKERVASINDMPPLTSKIAELFDPSKLKQFSLDKIEYVCDLGEGQFGLVFKGIARGLDESKATDHVMPVAVKTLKHEGKKDDFHQEVALMSILDHPHVVKLIAVATEEDPYCMIFEFMEYGDLNKFLREIKPLDDTQGSRDIQLCLEDFLSICCQVAAGMEYLASLHFVHRDLATRNCLVGEGLVVKIADFGMSRDIYSSDYYKVHGDAMLPVRWMPPEALLHGRFTVQSDVYSFGVLMWEVFTFALQPFYGYSNEEVMAFAKQGVLLGQPDESPAHIYNLMCECWNRQQDMRPNFTTIVQRLVACPPAPSQYDTLNNTKRNTLGITRPSSDAQEKTSTYQSPGTIINQGFAPDQSSKVALSC